MGLMSNPGKLQGEYFNDSCKEYTECVLNKLMTPCIPNTRLELMADPDVGPFLTKFMGKVMGGGAGGGMPGMGGATGFGGGGFGGDMPNMDGDDDDEIPDLED